MSIAFPDNDKLGFFSQRLLFSMSALNLTPKELAPRIGCSYEFVRRMLHCESLPSPQLLRRINSVFQWNTRKIEELIRLDECRKKFGAAFWSVIGKDPRMEPVYILFPYLTAGERQMMVSFLRFIVEANTKKSGGEMTDGRQPVRKQPVAEL